MSRTTQLLERMMWFWLLILGISIGQVVWWSLDRSPPFRVDAVRVQPVRQGGLVVIEADVWRDMRRQCGVVLSSNLYDSTGTRWPIDATIAITSSGLAAVEKKSPGKLYRKIPLPDNVAVGPASIVSSMSYACNPLQELLRPIQLQTEFSFEVMP